MGVRPAVNHQPLRSRLGLLSIILFGMALRWHLWTTFRFREDEALYGYWAWLIYSRIDVMLQTAPVDKPPLFPYLLASLYDIFGPSEASARLPNLLASTLSLPLVYAWARDLLGRDVAWRALLLYTVMPLAVLLAPTAYMDALMVGFALLSAWAAGRHRPHPWAWALVSGLALGAGMATKPFVVLWLPLVWGLALIQQRITVGWAFSWAIGFAYPLWRWWTWERLRGAPSTLLMGMVHYGGLGWAPPNQWVERIGAWVEVAAASWGGTLMLALVLITAVVGLWQAIFHVGRDTSTGRVIGWLWVWNVMVVLGYTLSTLAVWDRYLLTLAPVWAVLTAWGWHTWARYSNKKRPDARKAPRRLFR